MNYAARQGRKARWERLPKHMRFLIMSVRPSPIESDEAYRRDTLADLEEEYGPRTLPLSVAQYVADAEENKTTASDDYAMSLGEIGDEIGASKERVRQIILRALSKLRLELDNRQARCASRMIAHRELRFRQDLRRFDKAAPYSSTQISDEDKLDVLYGRISAALLRAKLADTEACAAKARFDVAILEEKIALILPSTDPEGAAARRGAVRAAMRAGQFGYVILLAHRYLEDPQAPTRLKASLAKFYDEAVLEFMACGDSSTPPACHRGTRR